MKTVDVQKLTEVRDQLLSHEVYTQTNTPERIKLFMEYHVFAVWDFMNLLKRLQQSLTCLSLPWMPEKHAQYARFINEIVLGEETDEDGEGGYISHFELYLQAMKEVGANTKPIEGYLERLQQNMNPFDALKADDIPESVQQFVHHTLHTAYEGEIHEVAASFFFGREDIIPKMFSHLVQETERENKSAKKLNYYLHRHIELDGDEHGPLAEKLLQSLCAGEQEKIEQAEQVAIESLQKRIELWNGVLEEYSRRESI
ncbi:DUF3050 domain-containing protein [Caldalkalibacillus mannanilyticus]|uniref:DUF3050 domain-containing protein n=1 Tax=Caldalkalibacillus mannanilyticus TaxID=1418 RepID=UPI00046A64E2|nr:DUF3050 domain-containing protein [Caldalkalibacillus mannanilyticus]